MTNSNVADITTQADTRPVEWLMLSAAVLHLWELDVHGRAWWGYAVFFLMITVSQGLYSLLLPRFSSFRGFLVAGVLGNTALIALWAWTRFVGGIPIGPHRHIEPVGLIDGITVTVQVVAVVLLVKALKALIHLRSTDPAPVRATAPVS